MRRLLVRFASLSFLWWVLTDGHPASWWLGLPVLTLTTLLTLRLRSRFEWHWNVLGMIRFAPFFFLQSLRGGVDVAWRALSPRMPLTPMLINYPLRLPKGPARVFLANTVSLLPGTCSTALQDEYLTIHVLDGTLPIDAALRVVEARVANLFGLEIPPAEAVKEGSSDG